MTLEDKVMQRIHVLRRNHNRDATGLVVDRQTYANLRRQPPWETPFVGKEYNREYTTDGDTYMGLDVAISMSKDMLVVY